MIELLNFVYGALIGEKIIIIYIFKNQITNSIYILMYFQ